MNASWRKSLVLLLAVTIAFAVVGCGKKRPSQEIAAESARREALRRRILVEADAGRAERLSSRSDVAFEEGFSKVLYDPPHDWHNNALRWMGRNAHVRVKRHGDKRMKLRAYGWVDSKVLNSWPTIAVYFDGLAITGTGPIEKGNYGLEAEIDPAMFHGEEWADVNMVLSTIAFHWAESPTLMVALVNRFDWEELP